MTWTKRIRENPDIPEVIQTKWQRIADPMARALQHRGVLDEKIHSRWDDRAIDLLSVFFNCTLTT